MVFGVRSASVGLATGSHAELRGQGPRAEAVAARRLPPRSRGATTGERQLP
jgi:hypothetical protein